MKAIVLDDHSVTDDFFPFTLTRAVPDIRIGILTLREKWTRLFDFTILDDGRSGAPVIPANVLPDAALVAALQTGNQASIGKALGKAVRIGHATEIVKYNETALLRDFTALTRGRVSAPIPDNVQTTAAGQIFLEEGAVVDHSILNASTGPIYIGRNALVMEGTSIRGPFSLGEESVVKMGSRIYGSTSVGPHCTVGGEIKNSVIFGFTNKAHDGYLGDSVLGEYCNLGAGTINSNIKNTASDVRVWNDRKKSAFPALQKCGLLMGDYSRSAVQTAFNTGTVVGVCCNVFGAGLTPGWIPSFSWGYSPVEPYQFEKALEHIRNWKKLKGKSLDPAEIHGLKNIFDEINTPS